MKLTKSIPTLQNQSNNKLPELEKNEVILSVQGILSKVNGKTHESGGENIALNTGDRIYSSKIKFPKEIVAAILDKKIGSVDKMSPSDLSQKFSTKQYDDLIKNATDKRTVDSAKLMKDKNLTKLDIIFQAQQEFKERSGVQEGKLLSEQGLDENLNQVNNEVNNEINPQMQAGGYYSKDKYQLGKGETFIPSVYNKVTDTQKVNDYYGDAYMQQLKRLGITAPTSYDEKLQGAFTKQDGYLKDHPFIKDNMNLSSLIWDNANNKWHDLTDSNKIKELYNLGYSDGKIRNTIKDYQKESIGLNSDGTYRQGKEWQDRRSQVATHQLQGNPHNVGNWRHQKIKEIILPDGTKDYEFTNYNDGDNRNKQVGFLPTYTPQRQQINVTPSLPSRLDKKLKSPNLPKLNLPSINKADLPSIKTPYPSTHLEVPDALQKAKFGEYINLFSREKAVPYLRNDNQTTAYQRTLPLNTLAQERSQNFLNRTYNNSDVSSQMSQSFAADNYAKTLEGIGEVQLRNYQGALQTDNQNNQAYQNAYNSNELAKNNNMADYVGKTQIVQDQYDKEGERMFDNIKNYDLQKANNSDDWSKRRIEGLLTNQKFIPSRDKNRNITIEQSPTFTRLDTNAGKGSILDAQNSTEMDKILDSGDDPKIIIERLRELNKRKAK